jgi:tetratricopeptide (TPR) repeat protein
VVALGARLYAARVLGALPISQSPQLDSAEYLNWARLIAENGFAWPPYPEHAPAYPFFAGAILAVSGGSLMAIRIAQSILGSIACVLTARIASRATTPSAFLPAGLLMALYGPLLYIDTAILAESPLVFLLVWGLDLATGAKDEVRRWLACGLVMGAAAIVRPTALVVCVAFLAVLIATSPRLRRVRLASAFVAGVLLFTAPVVIQNWRTSGLAMVQAYGGMNFYLGNRPSGDGGARARLGGEWDRLEGEASRNASSRNDQDRYYIQKTINEITDRPGAYLKLLASKLAWTFQDEELRDTHSYYFFVERMPLLRFLPSFGWILALAAGGIALRRSPWSTWLLAYAVAATVTTVFLVLGTRYRMPMVPVVMAFAGGGVMTFVERVRARDWKQAGTFAAIAVVVWGLSEVRHDAASHDFAEEWAFTGLSLLQAGNIEDAENAYRTAISIEDSSFAWDGLGLVLQRRLLRNDAREAFERAVQINPDNATAWLHLGLAYEYLRNPRLALDAYAKALSITPARTDAREIYEGALRRYR